MVEGMYVVVKGFVLPSISHATSEQSNNSKKMSYSIISCWKLLKGAKH